MRVRRVRQELDQIPGALLDVPPLAGASGDEDGVVGSTLYCPDATIRSDPGEAFQSMSDDREDESDNDAFDPVFEWGADSEEAIRKLGDAADERIRKSVEVDSGSDALGHYISFHVRGAQWGATVKASGVAWLATRFFNTLPTDDLTRWRLAFHAILQHELFHFATDVAVSQAELGQQQAWWRPTLEARRTRGEPYSHREERLANVWMLRAFRTALPGYQVRGKQAALKAFVRRQPAGYRDALTFEAHRWDSELRDLVFEYAQNAGRQYDNPLLWGEYDWACQFPVRPRIDWRNCPIHFKDDSARFGIPPGWLTFLSHLHAIDESDKFLKQLAKLGRLHQERWLVAKQRAMDTLTAGHDFKPWPKGGHDVWSLRVDPALRAHLQRDRANDRWIAIEIGNHGAMGHG
ncbi:hypothetical protein [Luteimonas sp. MC1828]|uniref:hypothetical protein n=1 Tax=Luteimonas sp. MC1828 TaxID=2799787 RepID=UPI0018F20C89|nr:hypothetical protein [Luteimonas sp. MC1828]MBJ7574543.1 hypothetical protein [Luteimonas sp. MC1828]